MKINADPTMCHFTAKTHTVGNWQALNDIYFTTPLFYIQNVKNNKFVWLYCIKYIF